MAKKSKKPSYVDFQFISLQQQILAAGNVCRWKPTLAIEWMDEAQLRLSTLVIAKLWNKTARYINKTTQCIQRMPYYNQEAYWGENNEPEVLEYIQEDIIDIQEYMAHALAEYEN